jgi:hypothetical protein
VVVKILKHRNIRWRLAWVGDLFGKRMCSEVIARSSVNGLGIDEFKFAGVSMIKA